VTALAARLRPSWTAALGRLAELAGRAARQVGRGVPGTAGPLLICYGIHQMYVPAAFIVAGGFLLLLDRRVP
jgi:hypothetical protein